MITTQLRGASLAAFVLAAVPAGAAGPYPDVSIELDIKRAPDSNVYYVVGQSGVPGADNEGFTSNAGFVITDEGVVVYDALGTPSLGWELLQAIRERTDKPVRHVIVGHYHADHIYGLQAFTDHTEANIIAHERALDYINSEGAQSRLEQRREALYPWVDEDTRLVEPDKTFRDSYRFTLGGQSFRVLYAGPAHSPSDLMMLVKPSGVVFSGDIIFSGRLPFLGGNVDTDNWLAKLGRLKDLEPSFVIPGHGKAMSDPSQAIAFTRGYIEYLREQMGEAVRNLVSFEEAYANTDWSRYADVPTFDAANRGNAYSVYLEMQDKSF